MLECYSQITTPPATWQTIDDLKNNWLELIHRIKNAHNLKRLMMYYWLLTKGIYFRWGHYEPVLEMRKHLTNQLHNPAKEAKYLERIAQIYFRLGYSEQSVKFAKRGLEFPAPGNIKQKLLATLGEAYTYLGKYQLAIDCFEQGLAIVQSPRDLQQEGFYLAQIGFAYYNIADTKKMMIHYDKALDIAKTTDDISLKKTVLGYLGKAYSMLGDYQKTLEYAAQALEISRRLKDRYEECMRLSDLGDGSIRLGNYEHAIVYLTESLEIAKELGAKSAMGYRFWLGGWAYLGTKPI